MYEVDSQDTVEELVSAPRPDIGAPLPQLLVTEHRLILAYLLSEPDPNWDGTYVNMISPETSGLAVAIVDFRRLDRLLEPVARCLPADVARKVVQLRVDSQTQDRIDELAAKANEGTFSIRVVDCQYRDSRSADGSGPDQPRTAPTEIRCPGVFSGVKKPSQSSSLWVEAGYVRTLRQIASATAEGEIVEYRSSSMLPRNNMVKHVGQTGNLLRQSAIFAIFAGTPTNHLLQALCNPALHAAGLLSRSDTSALALRMISKSLTFR